MHSKTERLFLVLCVFFINCSSLAQGIRCWTCENAISNDDCILRGRSVNCYSDGMGCSSEVRYHAGFVFKIQIKKGCKQILACGSDKSQNGHGWYPVQCNPKYPDSICRCCCQTRDCNKNLVGCEPPQPDCRELVSPENGYMICNNEDYPTALRSTCTFFCNRGYEMKGDRRTQCVLHKPGKAIWTASEPRCYNKRCKPIYKNTVSRRVECTDKNIAGSECTFTCAKGHTMNGEPKSTCLYSKNWDYPPPDCVKIRCPPAIIPPQHGSIACTEGHEYGSICRYICDTNYKLIGNGTRECVLSNTPYSAFGEWSGSLPQCAAIKCEPKQLNPTSGTVECTDMNYIGSNCKYECKNDYVLEGINSNTCVLNRTSGEGRWTSEPPLCTATRCPTLDYNTTRGKIICSNKNNVGSMCALSCSAGSFIRAPSSPDTMLFNWIVSCLHGGVWSQEPAECAPITCSPDVTANKIPNGIVLCSDKNNYQSECLFSCNEGFELVGQKRITCRAASGIGTSGEWDNKPPTCKIIGCPAIPKSRNGIRVSCTERYEEGSTCSFSCRGGYFLSLEGSTPHTNGKHSIECLEGNVWSGPIAECLQLRCLPTLGAVPNVIAKCSNGNKFKSRCTFSCNVAYGLEGRPVSVCGENSLLYGEGKWSATKPSCIRNGCAPRFASPKNGKMSCTNKNLFNSACTFSCRPGSYMKSHDNYLIESNSLTIRCSTEGDWSQIPPTCHQIICKPRNNEVVSKGNVTCSNGNNYKSKCTYTCNEGYEVNGETDTAVCTDKLTSSAFGLWSNENIKCRRASCIVRLKPPNGGKVGCSAGDGVGSECLYFCYKDFI
uniref:P-selectin-like n=1 Tax=Styela clava TaxID=7725 RepID=UPI0019392C36|nr:P-selectin-like [Styela clava]